MRRRRSWVWAVLIVLAAGGGCLAVLGFVMKQEPEFYTRPEAIAAAEDDPATASMVQTRVGDLLNGARSSGTWGGTFTAADLNAYLRESRYRTDLLFRPPPEMADTRVAVDGDHLKVGFRYGDGPLSTVVSVEVRAWMVEGEANTFALEILGVSAGKLPLSKRWATDKLSEAARGKQVQIDVQWYRDRGNPVAVCKVFGKQPNSQLLTLKLADGQVAVGGKTKE